MNRQAFSFWLVLMVWQIARFSAMTLFLASEWQSYVLSFMVAGLMVDAFALNRCLVWFGKSSTTEKLLPQIGVRDSGNLSMLGIVLYICGTAFSASVALINGTGTVMTDGPVVGPVAIVEAVQHPEAGCLEFSEGAPQIDYLGAVCYSVTSKVKEYFYAVPFVNHEWTTDQEVAVWAILSEYELTSGDFQNARFAQVVPSHNLHYDAFDAAVTNAEERHAIRSDSAAILVRLLDGPPATTGMLSTQTTWIGLIYLLTWLAAGPYAAKLFAEAPATAEAEELAVASVRIPSLTSRVSAAEDQAADSELLVAARSEATAPAWMRRRIFWLSVHLGTYAGLAISLLSASFSWLVFLFMLPAAAVEVWLALRAFRNPEVRASGRMACLMLGLPTSMFFAILFLAIGAVQFSEGRSVSKATRLDITQPEIPTDGEFLELTGNPILRDDLAGAFWAPTEDARTRWMTPVVSSDWCSEMPVRIWAESTDRSQARFSDEPLRYVRLITNRSDFRRAQALDDAVQRYSLTSAPDALVVERVPSPEGRAKDGGGMVVLGAICSLLGWSFSACFWPKERSV